MQTPWGTEILKVTFHTVKNIQSKLASEHRRQSLKEVYWVYRVFEVFFFLKFYFTQNTYVTKKVVNLLQSISFHILLLHISPLTPKI